MIIGNLRNITPDQFLAMIEDNDEWVDVCLASIENFDDLKIIHFSIGDEDAGSLSGEEIREAMRRAGRL